MGKDSTGGIPLMRKDHHKSLGVKKAADTSGGIPLTGMDNYEIVDVSKAAGGGGGCGDGKRPRGVGGAKGITDIKTFSPADLKTAVKVTDEYFYEEEHRAALKVDGTTFSSTHRSTIKTGVKVTSEYCHEEETSDLSEEGVKQEGEDMQDDAAELLADGDSDGAEMRDDRSGCGGGGGYYNEDAGVGDVDDFLNGDSYYYDVVAGGGFDDGSEDYDGGAGPDYWW